MALEFGTAGGVEVEFGGAVCGAGGVAVEALMGVALWRAGEEERKRGVCEDGNLGIWRRAAARRQFRQIMVAVV